MKVLLLENIHPVAVETLERHGHEVELRAGSLSEDELVAARVLPELEKVRASWEGFVLPHLTDKCGLTLPMTLAETAGGRDLHTEHLAPLLAEMQGVAREHADAKVW